MRTFRQLKESRAESVSEDVEIIYKRESEEHPNSFPIIIALDVTGSMGRIPYELITEGFPKLMKKIMDEGVQDLQVCKEIPEIISGIVLKSYYATKAKPAVQEGTKSESETIIHLR